MSFSLLCWIPLLVSSLSSGKVSILIFLYEICFSVASFIIFVMLSMASSIFSYVVIFLFSVNVLAM